jgi:hypothetical protein
MMHIVVECRARPGRPPRDAVFEADKVLKGKMCQGTTNRAHGTHAQRLDWHLGGLQERFCPDMAGYDGSGCIELL